ncbi:MAG: S41 family peptidase [Chitinophagales bacterium]
MPLIFAVVLIVGMQLGFKMYEKLNGKAPRVSNVNGLGELQEVFNYIDAKYVDGVNDSKLAESAIEAALKELDPHSNYISPEDLQAVNEDLQGNFEGIGVEFSIVRDTIMVVTPIAGGPSEKLGILSGDQIIAIEDSTIAGIGITNEQVVKRLRGNKGSSVNVSIKRKGVKDVLKYDIVRDDIPLYSVDVSYMMDDETGYVKINRFSRDTYNEFMDALSGLKQKGMDKLILDLRQNPGGYLTAAVDISDELIDGQKLLVYMQGQHYKRKEYRARKAGLFEDGDLVILVDEGSASASEIVSGAVQDWDRGMILGRRSFGKGLVQEQYDLSNGGALRLTVARYYTPTGRSIQKPYEEGVDAYRNEIVERYEQGELQSEDSVKVENDSLVFKTLIDKRTVYGGGGIMPDTFVPLDTTQNESFVIQVRSVIPEFAYEHFSNNQEYYRNFKSAEEYRSNYSVDDALYTKFKNYIKKSDLEEIKYDEAILSRDKETIKTYIKAYIARQLWQSDGFYPIIHDLDETLKEAYQKIHGTEMAKFGL